MKNFFTNKIFKQGFFSLLILSLILGGFLAYNKAMAAANITSATGGGSVSIDTTSDGGTGAWTALTGPVITEGAIGDIALGIHTLTLPTGWEFNTGQNVTIAVGGSTELTLANQIVTPGETTLSFNVQVQSSTGIGVLTFSNVKVRPTGTTAPSSGSILYSGVGIVGVDGSTNFGTLSTIPGVVTQVGFSTEPTNTVYGSVISSIVVTTQDQFGNNSVASLGANEDVSITKDSGSGTLTGSTTKDIGTSVGNGSVTFDDLEFDVVDSYVLTATSTSFLGSDSDSFDITAKQLTIGGSFTASDKEYDGTTTAATSSNSLLLSGVVGSDDVNLATTSIVIVFATSAAGEDIIVSIDSAELDGAEADQYTLSLSGAPTTTADITAKELTIGGTFTANNKVYNGETNAVINDNSLSLVGVVAGDENYVDLTEPTIVFADSIVDTAVSVSISSIDKNGDQAGNYTLSLSGAPTTTADITARPLTVTIEVSDKVYDSEITATITSAVLGNEIDGDDVSATTTGATATFAASTVGAGILVSASGITLEGSDASNYSLAGSGNATTTANITVKEVEIDGTFEANNKIYDGGVIATGTTTSLTLPEKVDGDDLGLTNIILHFADKTVADGKTVSIFSAELTGTDSENYTLSSTYTPTTTANITEKILTATSTVENKIYDGTTDATTTSVSLVGVLGEDDVSADFSSATATFATSSAGTGITATTTGIILAGTDADNYSFDGISITTADISKFTPVITWADPSDMVAGTALSGSQLDATVEGVDGALDGAFVYDPVSTTVITLAGSHTLETVFTPTDTINYNTSSASVTLEVVPASISEFEISASPTSLAMNSTSVITVVGKDQYDNIVDNDSTTLANLMSDDSVNFGNSLLTLTEGIATTSLTKASAGLVNITVFRGLISPDEVQVTFTDTSDTIAPVISEVSATTTQTTATISFESNESGLARLSYYTGSVTPITTDYISISAETEAEISLAGLACGTTYSYTLYAQDSSASANEASATSTFATLACDAVTSPSVISAEKVQKDFLPDNGYPNGWEWRLLVTLPDDENGFAIKFADWVSGSNTLATASNVRYYLEQVGVGDAKTITTANTYPDDYITVSSGSDVLSGTPGVQVYVIVQVKVPSATPAGSYSTSYQIETDTIAE